MMNSSRLCRPTQGPTLCLVVAISIGVAGCSSADESSEGSTGSSVPSCGLRDVQIVDGSTADPEPSTVTVSITDAGDGDAAIAASLVQALETARLGETDEGITANGTGELEASGFELPVDDECSTVVTVDADVGAGSASLRFTQLDVDLPGCDAIRFRIILLDTWQIDGVTPPNAEVLEQECGDAA